MARRPGSSFTRDDVLDAALVVVTDHGPEALGTKAVAQALGITAPSIYHHFAGNDALRLAVAVRGWRALVAALPAPGGDLGVAIRGFANAYRGFALANPSLYRLMTETPLDPQDEALLGVTRAALGALGGLGLPGFDALHALRGLRAAVHGFVHLEVSGQMRLAVSPNDSFDWLVDLAIAGFEKRQRQGP